MEQLEMFEDVSVVIRYECKPGWKKGWWRHTATVVEDGDFPIIFVEAELWGRSKARAEILKVARLAYLLRFRRPMGNSYNHGPFDVVYLFDNEE